jgi:hypothetical protein
MQDGERRRRTSSVSWRTLGSGGLTWQREEGTARLARAVGKGVERRVDRGAEWQMLGSGRRQGHARAAGKTEELRYSRRKTEDPDVKSKKLGGLTVKHGQLSHHCSNEDGPKSKSV